jgi:polysaccharide biosynthesis transport protein
VNTRDKYTSSPSSAKEKLAAAPETDLFDILGVLRKKWAYPIVGSLLGFLLGYAIVTTWMPTLFKSTARLIIENSNNRYLQTNKIVDGPTLDDMETGSQIYILSSESILLPVIRSLRLAEDPEFGGVSPSADPGAIKRVVRSIKDSIGWNKKPTISPETARERIAVETLLRRLSINREDVANVIQVSFTASEPRKAADIANAIVEAYLAATLNSKYESNKLAATLLGERLAELKRQLENADRELREYKGQKQVTSSGVAQSPSGAHYSAEIASLNSRLLETRVALIESKTRLERIQDSQSEGKTAEEIPDNPVTLRLRSQYLELAIAATEIEGRVGANHHAVQKLRRKMGNLERAIQAEKIRVSRSYPNELPIIKSQYQELAATYDRLVTETGLNYETRLALRQLEFSSQTIRRLYNEALQKYTELYKEPSASLQDVRVITKAAPSLSRDTRKPILVLGGSIAFGLCLGLGVAIARELTSRSFRTPLQVKNATEKYCAIAPAIHFRRRRLAGATIQRLEEHVLDEPHSRFTDTIRNIKVQLNNAARERGDKVIAVVSCVANEGKTTILTNLGALLATSPCVRVLIIDGDVHRPNLTARLAPDAREGLLEALSEPYRLAEIVSRRERSCVDVLACCLEARIPNAGELLGSPEMERLLAVARETYDFILIEVPPIMSVVDVKMVERLIDRFVFVIEWGGTSRRLLHEALSEVSMIRDRLLCFILNKADPDSLGPFYSRATSPRRG